jgi:hypothetical protein
MRAASEFGDLTLSGSACGRKKVSISTFRFCRCLGQLLSVQSTVSVSGMWKHNGSLGNSENQKTNHKTGGGAGMLKSIEHGFIVFLSVL